MEVLEIVVHEVPAFTEDSHLITLPVCPESDMAPLFKPTQPDAEDGVSVPPTETGFTVTVAEDEFEILHTPLCTTALYCVVCVMFV